MPFLREKSGRWSPEKIIAFVGSCVPILWLAWRVWTNDLNPARPVNEAIHSVGNYAIWLIVISLTITPARRLFMAPKLINMRRTLGVAAFCYAALHFTLYFVQEKFDLTKIASEIVFRIYLTIGFVALLGLIALTATSTDAMIRRLGPRWNTLHKIVYAIAILGIIHFMMQTKLDITEAVMVGGLLDLAARLPPDASLCRQRHVCLADRADARRRRADGRRRGRMVRRDHRRDVVARVLGQLRLGHGVPPRALGADRRAWRHVRVARVVVRFSAPEGAQGFLKSAGRRAIQVQSGS